MEIVSKPDLRSAKQAQAYVSKLRSILRYLGTCDGDMEKGNLRADVNVSVRRPGAGLGTRCEIKNVNSIRFIGQAIEYEARRQIDILEDGGTIEQETRLFDSAKGVTRSMRTKEEAHDYRYFPDPDLLPLELTQEYVDGLKKGLPELPDAKRQRFMSEYGLSPTMRDVLVAERESAEFFEAVAKEPTTVRATHGRRQLGHQRAVRPPEQGGPGAIERQPDFGQRSSAPSSTSLPRSAISGKIAKDVFEIVWSEGGDPADIVEKRGLQPGHRHRRHREGRRRDHRRQPRQGGGREGQARHARLVRRPGHEIDRRQSQPAGRQRAAEEEARDLGGVVSAQSRHSHRRLYATLRSPMSRTMRARAPASTSPAA